MSLKTNLSNPPGRLSPKGHLAKLIQPDNGVIFLGAASMFVGYTALPLSCPLAILLFPACLFWLARTSASGRLAFRRGWYLGLWGFSSSLYWLTVPMTTVGEMPLVLAIPCVLLLGSFLGLYTGLACFSFRGLILFFTPCHCVPTTVFHTKDTPSPPPAPPGKEARDEKNCPSSHSGLGSPLPALPLSLPPTPGKRLLLLLLAGLCYGGIEFISSFILTGFPWLSLPVALAGTPVLTQPVSLVGAYGYSALLVFFALSPFMLKPVRGRFPWIALWMTAFVAGTGIYSYQSFHRPITGKEITVGIVQANIDQNQKWHPAMQTATVQKHVDLSLKAIEMSNSPLNLLLWPETAMPFFYQQGEPYRSQLHEFAKQHSVNLAFGTLGYIFAPPQRAHHFNRLQLVSHRGRPIGHYDKEHLVPFGEYNPIPVTFDFLENILQGVNFSAGKDQPLLLLPDNRAKDEAGNKQKGTLAAPAHVPVTPEQRLESTLGRTELQHKVLARLGSLICYEVIFPSLAQKRVSQGSDVLVTISNDSWFGKTAAPQQHLNHAVLRAIEQGRSIVRSTTSGYSALILPNGEVKHKSSLYTEAAYSFAVPLATHKTVYHILHHGIDLLLLLGLCITVGFGYKFRNL